MKTTQYLTAEVRRPCQSITAAVFRCATPLRREDVASYLQLIAEQLRARPMIGDGDVYRAIEVAQREYFQPPVLAHFGVIKYGR
jgi:hypothetical protein